MENWDHYSGLPSVKAYMNINDILTDEELEDCIDGSSDINMIRQAIVLTQKETLLDEESFADLFAYNISGFIDYGEGTPDWDIANDNNWDWGYMIAKNINEVVTDKFTK